ncbi:MAG: hypothetical protein HRT69_08705, partial [Flavobacteriaceae bacterium]|nr:hypothetical protein [Flavobacteriaceae bacterium]
IGKSYASENGVDNQQLIAINNEIRNHPVEKIGAKLRASMTSMKQISLN